MKKLHKQPVCLNCSRPLSSSDNFCPACGQENNVRKLGLGVLMHDFFSNYFSFDSKITRSTIPFLIKPGALTNYYNEGKRTSFIHPLRLYLIISFIFFFLLALLIDQVIEDGKISLVANGDHKGISTAAPVAPQSPKLQAALDTAESRINAKNPGSVDLPDTAALRSAANMGNRFVEILMDRSLTDEQVLDSLEIKMNKDNDFSRLVIHQTRKIAQKDMDVFLPYLGQNLSILMFLLLPIFAFYLYVLFGRKEKYYISHAIHALHLHSFSFLVLGLLILLEIFFSGFVSNNESILIIAFLLITLYALFSIKRVYGQGWGKTILKFNILGFFYFISLSIGAVLEAFASFMFF